MDSPVFPFEAEIAERARRCGLEISSASVDALAGHARSVLFHNERLHLTTIVDPAEFMERHIAEAFEGARLLQPGIAGLCLDLGSGNGYPGLPVTVVRPGLKALLAEASAKKAAFLHSVIGKGGFPGAMVHEGQVQRPGDLAGVEPARLLVSRAMGAWEKIIPRMATALTDDGELLLWAGEEAEKIFQRKVWRRFQLVSRTPLPRRERSWIYRMSRVKI